MPRPALLPSLLAVVLLSAAAPAAGPPTQRLGVFPATVSLVGKSARQRLLVSEYQAGRTIDRTRQARFTSATPSVVAVSSDGIVTPVGDGEGIVTVRVGELHTGVRVRVRQASTYRPATFERDIEPILTRAGCNAGACHGKARGQNGFALSLLGFDPDFDYHAIVSEARGRRLFPADPGFSLLLRKASAQLAHGGGKKLPADGPEYDLLHRWIAAGCPRTPAETPRLVRISVEPEERLLSFRAEQQLAVTAHYSDGSSEDVTHLAAFQSNDSVFARVDQWGKVQAGTLPGEAAIMARFMEKFAVCHVLIPMPGAPPASVYEKLPRNNFIDALVWDKLRRLGLGPSDPAADHTFHRRAFLDIIGRLPTPAETRAFLADRSADKRSKLIDRLLARPEYADFWASKWADLLRPNPYRVGIKATFTLDAWLRDSFRRNKPYDRFVRELLTAQGSTFRNGAVVVFRDRREPDEITTLVSQLFLGIRLDCARCHHHPFEVWGQDDFYRFAAYFARLGRKGVGVSPPISGGEEVLYVASRGQVTHPTTGKVMSPRPLFGSAAAVSEERDPRAVLADWVTSRSNPYFARVIVNRVWADLMGRGLVEPVDDLRATNPATNSPLLDALAEQFRKDGCDLKKLIRTICTSHVYGLSSLPKGGNAHDTRNSSRHYRERLRAEVLLDAVSDVTGVPESFPAVPPGARAVEVWTARSPSLFLDSFGRPDPNQDPPCERTTETSVVQALHLMNAENIDRKIGAATGRAARLAAGKQSPAQIVEELYLRAYSRFPTAAEKTACVRRFERPGAVRRQVIEDLMWALINTPEFVFKD